MKEDIQWGELLDELGINQAELAKSVRVTKGHISKLISGQAKASDLLKFAIEKEYGVNRLWFEDNQAPMFLEVSAERRRVMRLAEGLSDEQARAVSVFIRLLREEGL